MNIDRPSPRRLDKFQKIRLTLLCLTFYSVPTYAQSPREEAQAVKPATEQSEPEIKLGESKVSSSETTQRLDTQAILSRVQAFYAQATDFKAEFKQTYTYHIYGRKKLSTGTVYFKKPAKMRWDYEVPTQKVFVADGETLWVYEPEESQVFKRDLSSAQLPVALRFMRGDASLDKEFNVQPIEETEESEVIPLILTPKSPSPDFKTLELHVRRKDGQVQSSVLIDPTGNRNRIDFVDVRVNQSLPNSGFSFTPPEGVRVIDEESPR